LFVSLKALDEEARENVRAHFAPKRALHLRFSFSLLARVWVLNPTASAKAAMSASEAARIPCSFL